MGTTASLRDTNEEPNASPSGAANSVRERLRNEFGTSSELEEGLEVEEDQDTGPKQGRSFYKMSTLVRAKGIFMKHMDRHFETKDTNIVKKQDNHALLKELYRRMDPTVMAYSGDRVVGEIEMSLKYKQEQNTLLVKVGRAKNLHLSGSHGLPDPYVQVVLSTTRIVESNPQCKRTKQKPSTNNPLFQEILVFSLEDKDVAEAKLKVSIWDKDKISDDDFLGEVNLELCKVRIDGKSTTWHKLLPQTDVSVSGNIEVSLRHQLPGTFFVTIHQASDLKSSGQVSRTSDPYVRCYVTGVPNKEETKVMPNTLNPKFEETFEFSVQQDEFEQRVLVLNVLSRESVSRDKRLGDVHIPLKDFDSSQTTKQCFNLADLRNNPNARNKWSEEGVSQEFREAMRAHAIYKYPRCIFRGKHQGQKMMSVSSEKARSSAKMMVVGGFPVRQ